MRATLTALKELQFTLVDFQFWQWLHAAGKAYISVTGFSMDEMEALCSRIAIMSKGSLVALGSAATLRANHAAGHAVVFKIRHVNNTDGEKFRN